MAASLPTAVSQVASASPLQLPAGYENFTTEIDYATFIGNAVKGSGSLTCKVDSTKGLPPFASALVGPGSSVNFDDSVVGTQLKSLFGIAGSEIASTCDVNLLLPSDRQTFTGSVSNPVLKDFVGTDTGTFRLECDLKGTIGVNASVRLGAALGAQKFAMTINSATTQVPFYCNVTMEFAGSTPSSLNGTVEGRADVSSAISPNPCDGSAVKSCAPIQLKDALVTITSGTGKFVGLTGSGTYNFIDTLGLPFVEEKLASVTSSSVSSSSASAPGHPKGVSAMTVSAEQMRLVLVAGAPKAKIVLPGPVAGATQASVARNSKITVATTAKAKCAWTARSKKSVAIASTTANAAGQSTLTLTGSRMTSFLRSGIKAGGTVTVTSKCASGKKSATAIAKFTYTG